MATKFINTFVLHTDEELKVGGVEGDNEEFDNVEY